MMTFSSISSFKKMDMERARGRRKKSAQMIAQAIRARPGRVSVWIMEGLGEYI